MWIGSSTNNKSKPFGIKWANEPIKDLDVFYTYNQRFLLEKNFIERLDSIKKPTRIWSSRGLSIYGKVTLIKSVLMLKFVYRSSLLPIPKEFVKELNQILFHFLWKGPDKLIRVSVIIYDKGGLKMTDVDSMVMSLRLAWLKRLFGSNDGGFSSLIAIVISEITQTFVTFIPSFCNGGLNSEKCLHLERIGST